MCLNQDIMSTYILLSNFMKINQDIDKDWYSYIYVCWYTDLFGYFQKNMLLNSYF
jgi:hypothetical protein